ncbi:MAG: GNAT family N-acetyltransferase [Candidatus Zixiibacteriota bacterium]
MNEIKKIPPRDIGKFIDIMADAYPGLPMSTEEDKRRIRERLALRSKDKRISYWAMYEGKEMLGALALYDYTMNLFGHKVLAGGGGSLAVGLIHKKEHVARDIMRFYFRHYRRQNAPFAVLWPFRPDFYKAMGCGLGPKGHVYKVKPPDLPTGGSKKHIRILGKSDMKALNDCYNRQVDRVTGMIEETLVHRKIRYELAKTVKYVGYENNGRIEGYILFSFERGKATNFVDNYIVVHELIYEHPEALLELMTFLRTQADQINRIIFHTNDDDFHYLLKDPRNDSGNLMQPVYHESHISGVGIMFRVLNTRQVFEILGDHDFGGQTVRLKLTATDSFLKENDGSLVIYFSDGKPEIKTKKSPHDVELKLDISDFSSLLMGAVGLKSLVKYGMAEVSGPEYIDLLHKLFATEQKPVCLTSF